MLTAFGVIAATVLVVSYALESRGSNWIAVFAGGCAATAFYGVLTGAWIFVVLESVWAVIALRRFQVARRNFDVVPQKVS
ncbi:MAG: hypothetical protein ACC652_04765 [Acidimicrobiales bacterium]